MGDMKAVTKRQKRKRRAQLRDSGFRIFTTDVSQVDCLRGQLEIMHWILVPLQFRSVGDFLFRCSFRGVS